MDKILAPIKQRILEYIGNKSIDKKKFYENINVAASNFRSKSLYSEIGGDVIAKISSHYPDINTAWLLTGEGSMLNTDLPKAEPASDVGIPMIPIEAFAGMGAGSVSITPQDIQNRYVIPDFIDVDFMIRITGASMYPKFISGDIVACRMLLNSTLFQWGRVYVLHHSDQGALVKRLFPGSDPDYIECRSDNVDFPAFKVAISDITNFAIVVGIVRIE